MMIRYKINFRFLRTKFCIKLPRKLCKMPRARFAIAAPRVINNNDVIAIMFAHFLNIIITRCIYTRRRPLHLQNQQPTLLADSERINQAPPRFALAG